MTAAGSASKLSTTCINGDTSKVVYVMVYRETSTGTYFKTDAKKLSNHQSLSLSLNNTGESGSTYRHVCRKYNSTNTSNYESTSVIDALYYTVKQK
jgi:hypothetical protein